MTDTERLNLIEYYDWMIIKQFKKWRVVGAFPGIAEGATLREVVDAALVAQVEWSLGK